MVKDRPFQFTRRTSKPYLLTWSRSWTLSSYNASTTMLTDSMQKASTITLVIWPITTSYMVLNDSLTYCLGPLSHATWPQHLASNGQCRKQQTEGPFITPWQHCWSSFSRHTPWHFTQLLQTKHLLKKLSGSYLLTYQIMQKHAIKFTCIQE